jgi:hypothetical protein
MKPEFAVHKLNADGMKHAQTMAAKFSDLLEFIESVAVQGRELSLATTKLEEASFFAKKAMAINLANQEPQV